MNFLKYGIIVIATSLIVSGCNLFSSNEDQSGNLITFDALNEGYWVGFSGDLNENSDYMYTEKINYNPLGTYVLNRNAYVSYYDDDSFIKTILHSGGEELSHESNANKIVISFNEDRIDSIELTRE